MNNIKAKNNNENEKDNEKEKENLQIKNNSNSNSSSNSIGYKDKNGSREGKYSKRRSIERNREIKIANISR